MLFYAIISSNIDRDTGQLFLISEDNVMIGCVTGHRPTGFPFSRSEKNAPFRLNFSTPLPPMR